MIIASASQSKTQLIKKNEKYQEKMILLAVLLVLSVYNMKIRPVFVRGDHYG